MAWKAVSIVETRLEFVVRVLAKEQPLAALCREYGITRRVGRKWVKRFMAEGESGLKDRSKRPKGNARSLHEDVAAAIVRIRKPNHWGCGVNLRPLLLREFPAERVPAARTIDRFLKKSGLVSEKKRRRVKPTTRLQTRAVAEQPNDIWTIDFKGWWFTQDHHRCEPLTLRDDFSRYLLCLHGMRRIRWELVQEVMTDVFQAHGLPLTIRSDNGAPFAHVSSLAGLTQLSAWWLALGIGLDRIDPGRPDQNGGHERMHRDMARQIERYPEANLGMQQAALDQWREHFNSVRPHSALGFAAPSEVYRQSTRKFPGKQFEIEYPQHYEVRKVAPNGWIKRKQKGIFISGALAGWTIGLEEEPDGILKVWFAELCLGTTDKNLMKLITPE